MDDKVWKDKALSKVFLDNVRGAIPFAKEQMEISLKIIGRSMPDVSRFLDLGCGDGVLGEALLASYPGSRGVFLDFSEPMLEKAKERLSGHGKRAEFILKDFGDSGWTGAVEGTAPFDAVISGLAIHHQTDEGKRRIYGEIFSLLSPGGVFINIEHVLSPTDWIKSVADDYFIDAIYAFNRGRDLTRDEVASEFYNRVDKAANILAPVEAQCRWLRNTGFTDVDCFFKAFELAVFGGRRP